MINLYRTFHPKLTSYPPDGFGRDSYILTDNGGVFRAGSRLSKFKSMGVRSSCCSPSPPLPAKPTSYHSDGMGRDSYICVNSGGLVDPYRSNINFAKSLRNSSVDFYDNPYRKWIPAKERMRKTQLRRTQVELSHRLSSPKRKTR
mmetsp:Transcript_971/g.2374  ORF Transcript_971/g.2374 Transcript_971/m.2374 type:complete len:145 (-) Transcript_971:46-480(-)